jgi:integrase
MPKDLLTDLTVRKAKPKDRAYRLHDGGGLTLYVPRSGVKAWQFRFRLDGKEQTTTLGKLERVTLAEARARADVARGQLEKGLHPTVEKRLAKARNVARTTSTFRGLADAWVKLEARRAKWTPNYQGEVEASIRNHLADLDGLPVDTITAAIAAPSLRRVERKAPDMSRKVRQRLRAILDHAVEEGLITANPIPAPRRRRRGASRAHLPALLDRKHVGAVLRQAQRANVSPGVRRAHLIAAFLAQRVGEITPAEWSEFDLNDRMWSIPRERMKRKDAERGPHLVPIPPDLLALMLAWRREDGEDATYVCPAPNREGPVTREAVEKFYRRTLNLSGKHSPHSWRSVFSTWANEAGKDFGAIEAQLDHVIGSATPRSYDRGERLEIRRDLVAWYESALIAARDGADVVPLRRGAQS